MVTDRNDPELIRAAQAGDVAARNRLIVANRGLLRAAVLKVVGPARAGIGGEEYEAVALEGFLRALRGYRPETGFRLSTYATHVMEQWVRREWSERDRVIKLPAIDVNTSPRRVAAAARVRWCRSLDAPVRWRDGEPRTLMSLVRMKGGEEATVSIEREERLSLLSGALEAVDARVRDVLEARARGELLHEIGGRLGISKERVRQLYELGIAQMRAYVDERLESRVVKTEQQECA